MLDVAILGQVALGYSPFIDRNRSVSATRLTVVPLVPDAVLDVEQLLAAVGAVWPAEGAKVALNIVSESLLHDLLQAQPSPNLMIEVPSFMAAEPGHAASLQRLAGAGNTLLLKGRVLRELPAEVLASFKYSVVDSTDEGRLEPAPGASGAARPLAPVESGVRTLADMEAAFERGAQGVLGWPIDDVIEAGAVAAKATAAPPDMQVIVELIRRVDAEEPIDKLEATMRRDPSLAFKLLRYINSPAFGLRVEVASFSHAIQMLGYQRLKRWLALLLATASKDMNLKPVMFAAVRRGLFMEELVRGNGDDELRGEVFICGVFSLLDRMFEQPFKQLLDTIPVPQRVYEALVEESGPFQPYIDMVRAVESDSLFAFRETSERLLMSVSEINRAELRALIAAAALE